jgi:ABC-2 type transport system ATP-binding protein
VINNGILIADDTLENQSRAGENRLLLSAEGPAEEMLQRIRSLSGLRSAEILGPAEEDGAFEFALEAMPGREIRRDLFRLLAEKGWPILSLRKNGLSLEEAFIRLTAGDHAALSALAGTETEEGKVEEGKAEEGKAEEEKKEGDAE